jgi:pyrophosphatase PpaX
MIKTILFDLDGTIIDTNELTIRSFLHTFGDFEGEPITREHIVPNMGRPLVEQMRFFSGRELVQDLVSKYREFNLAKHDEFVKEFPHVGEVLASLHAAGIKMGVVTSKMRLTSEMGLALCGIASYFDVLVTVDDVANPKPDAEGIYKAMEALGADKATTLMVGDSHYDIEAAHNAGIGSAAVAWSLKGIPYLESYRPSHIIRDMRELLKLAGVSPSQTEG